MENIIKKIEIEIAGVRVAVTLTEAKALFDALGELLNLPTKSKKEFVPYPVPQPYPVYPPAYPRIIWTTNGTQVGTGGDRYRISYTAQNSSAKMQIM